VFWVWHFATSVKPGLEDYERDGKGWEGMERDGEGWRGMERDGE